MQPLDTRFAGQGSKQTATRGMPLQDTWAKPTYNPPQFLVLALLSSMGQLFHDNAARTPVPWYGALLWAPSQFVWRVDQLMVKAPNTRQSTAVSPESCRGHRHIRQQHVSRTLSTVKLWGDTKLGVQADGVGSRPEASRVHFEARELPTPREPTVTACV